MLVHAEDPDPVQAVGIADEQSVALGQDGVIGGVPGHPEARGDASNGEVVDDQGRQCPQHPGPGQLRSRVCHPGRVLTPVATTVRALVAADSQQDRGGALFERAVRERTGDRSPRQGSSTAVPAPGIRIGETAFEDRAFRGQVLPGALQTELVQLAEGREVRGLEGSVGHVEVFRMASAGTSNIGRPRTRERGGHRGATAVRDSRGDPGDQLMESSCRPLFARNVRRRAS